MASFEIQVIITHDIEVDDDVIEKYIKNCDGDKKAGLKYWAMSEGVDEATDFGERMVKVCGFFDDKPVRFEL